MLHWVAGWTCVRPAGLRLTKSRVEHEALARLLNRHAKLTSIEVEVEIPRKACIGSRHGECFLRSDSDILVGDFRPCIAIKALSLAGFLIDDDEMVDFLVHLLPGHL